MAPKVMAEAPPKQMPKVAATVGAEKVLYQTLVIFIWIVIAVITLFVLAILLRLLFNLIRYFQKNIKEETRSVFSFKETKARMMERLKPLRGIGNGIQGSSNSIKIRRLYFKAIQRFNHAGTDIRGCDAPVEISEKVKQKANRDISDVTELYEKARYAKDECTVEELKAAKRSVENIAKI
jgi:hypothetical protein